MAWAHLKVSTTRRPQGNEPECRAEARANFESQPRPQQRSPGSKATVPGDGPAGEAPPMRRPPGNEPQYRTGVQAQFGSRRKFQPRLMDSIATRMAGG